MASVGGCFIGHGMDNVVYVCRLWNTAKMKYLSVYGSLTNQPTKSFLADPNLGLVREP